MQSGDVLETAIWMNGEETEELKDRFLNEVRANLAEMAEDEDIIIGPVIMSELKPGDDRVPPVPDGVHGPDVKLLVAQAMVVGEAFQSEGAFVADLEPRDLERLRRILRRVHQSYNPGKPELSQEKCDEYINQNGPDAALESLREQVGVSIH